MKGFFFSSSLMVCKYSDWLWSSTYSFRQEGKFSDNGGHEFNVSLKMDLTAAQLQTVLTKIRSLVRFVRYDIDEYNCTDFALDVFNELRTNKLTIPLYDVPGGMTAAGTSTPQGLYNQLKAMKQSNE